MNQSEDSLRTSESLLQPENEVGGEMIELDRCPATLPVKMTAGLDSPAVRAAPHVSHPDLTTSITLGSYYFHLSANNHYHLGCDHFATAGQ